MPASKETKGGADKVEGAKAGKDVVGSDYGVTAVMMRVSVRVFLYVCVRCCFLAAVWGLFLSADFFAPRRLPHFTHTFSFTG